MKVYKRKMYNRRKGKSNFFKVIVKNIPSRLLLLKKVEYKQIFSEIERKERFSIESTHDIRSNRQNKTKEKRSREIDIVG